MPTKTADDPAAPADGGLALPLEITPGHLIRRAQQVHTAIWAEEFGGDLTGPQYALVSVVAGAALLDQRSAGQQASLDKSTAADVVARLQRNGWITCEVHLADRRRKMLALTPVARSALREITPRARRVQQRLLAPLGPAEQRSLTGLLATIAFADGVRPQLPPAGGPPALDLSVTPGHLIRRAEQAHGVLWTENIGKAMTPSQYALLCAVARHPAIDQTAAGEVASLDKSSAADVVSRLVSRHWIGAVADAADRRRKLLHATADALAVLRETTPKVRLVQQGLAEPLSQRDRDRLIRLLRCVAYRSGPVPA